MAGVSRDINRVPADKVPAFLRLIELMTLEMGSERAACRRIGINSGQVDQLRKGDQALTETTARKILAGWRLHKELRK